MDLEHWDEAQRQLQGAEAGLMSEAAQPEPVPPALGDNAVLPRPRRLSTSAQVRPGVVKDGNTHRARRPD